MATEVGLPVVVKPHAGNQGKGVGVNLNCEAQVRHAYSVAAEYDSTVLVERYVEGDDYRLLVVDGKMVAAARRDPPQIIGDGIHPLNSLSQRLIKIRAADPGIAALSPRSRSTRPAIWRSHNRT